MKKALFLGALTVAASAGGDAVTTTTLLSGSSTGSFQGQGYGGSLGQLRQTTGFAGYEDKSGSLPAIGTKILIDQNKGDVAGHAYWSQSQGSSQAVWGKGGQGQEDGHGAWGKGGQGDGHGAWGKGG